MIRPLVMPLGHDLKAWMLACLLGGVLAMVQMLLLSLSPPGVLFSNPGIGLPVLLATVLLGFAAPCVAMQRLARRQHRWRQVTANLRWPRADFGTNLKHHYGLVLALAVSPLAHHMSWTAWLDWEQPMVQLPLAGGLLLALYCLALSRWPAGGLLANFLGFVFLLPFLGVLSFPLLSNVPAWAQWAALPILAVICWMLLALPVRTRRSAGSTGRWRAWLAAPLLLPRWRQERVLLPVGLMVAGSWLIGRGLAAHLPQARPDSIQVLSFILGQCTCVLLLSLLFTSAEPAWRWQLHPERAKRQRWLAARLAVRLLLGLMLMLPFAATLDGKLPMTLLREVGTPFSIAQAAALLLHLLTLIAAALLWRGLVRQQLRGDALAWVAVFFLAFLPIWLRTEPPALGPPSGLQPLLAPIALDWVRSPWPWLALLLVLGMAAQQVWARQPLHWLNHGARNP